MKFIELKHINESKIYIRRDTIFMISSEPSPTMERTAVKYICGTGWDKVFVTDKIADILKTLEGDADCCSTH